MEKWTIDVICGSIGGILGTLIGHPLDTMKVKLLLYLVSIPVIIIQL